MHYVLKGYTAWLLTSPASSVSLVIELERQIISNLGLVESLMKATQGQSVCTGSQSIRSASICRTYPNIKGALADNHSNL